MKGTKPSYDRINTVGQTESEERLPSLGDEDPSAPEMDKKVAAYVGVSSSGQEAACVELADSLGYRVDDSNVYRDVWSGGGADA